MPIDQQGLGQPNVGEEVIRSTGRWMSRKHKYIHNVHHIYMYIYRDICICVYIYDTPKMDPGLVLSIRMDDLKQMRR